jgi:hypothetical protein
VGVTRPRPWVHESPSARRRAWQFAWLWFALTLLQYEVAHAQVWLGLGYDGVSQAYFLSVADTSLLTPDSVLQLERTASAINEGQASLRTRVGSQLSWDQTTAYSSTYWQHRTTLAAYSPRDRSAWGGLEYRLNVKKPHEAAETSPYSDYLFQELHGRLQKQFSGFGMGLRGVLESVYYPHAQDFAYDYNQFRGEWKVSRASDPIHYQELAVLYQRRIVPDSARVSYRDAGVNVGVGWSVWAWRADAVLELSDRRYDSPEAGYDYGLARLRANWNDDGIQARWPGLLEVETYQYHSAVSILADFARVDFRQRRAFPLSGGWSPFVEPGVELVRSAVDEDYYEPRLVTGTELFRLDGWWAQADVGAGHRWYPNGDLAGFSDYWRLTTNLFVDGPLTRRLALTIMYTQDWEWHTETADDMSVLLLSAGLRYKL